MRGANRQEAGDAPSTDYGKYEYAPLSLLAKPIASVPLGSAAWAAASRAASMSSASPACAMSSWRLRWRRP